MVDHLVINTGVGNFEAIKNVLNYIGLVSKISSYNENFDNYKCIIIPGVGSFDNVMINLKKHRDFSKFSNSNFINKKKILGICAGMQVLFDKSDEGKEKGCRLISEMLLNLMKNRIEYLTWDGIRFMETISFRN